MTRGISKRVSEISSYDLDKNCRNIINQSSPKMRRLKKIIRKMTEKDLTTSLINAIMITTDEGKHLKPERIFYDDYC